MSVTISPNMSLIIPGVGTEAGPTYATDINNSLNLIDLHTHAPGSGVLITPSAININAALTMSGHFLTNTAGVTFTAQGSQPANNTIYQSGADLYFTNSGGTPIPITANGAVAGTPGSIANLVSPASATYVAIGTTFVWRSGVNLAANMDAASYLLRNISPNSTYALTLSPPTMSNDYTITLPILPASNLPMSINSSGTVTAVLLTGAQIAGTTITASNIANATITTTQISASAAIIGTQLSASAAIAGSQLAAAAGIVTGQIATDTITLANINDTALYQGVYTPTTNSSSNMSAITWSSAAVTRIGNVVSVSGLVSCTPAGDSYIIFTIPIASNMSGGAADCAGTGATFGASETKAYIVSNNGANTAIVRSRDGGAAAVSLYYTFSYKVN